LFSLRRVVMNFASFSFSFSCDFTRRFGVHVGVVAHAVAADVVALVRGAVAADEAPALALRGEGRLGQVEHHLPREKVRRKDGTGLVNRV
jgi:hypothetical protein